MVWDMCGHVMCHVTQDMWQMCSEALQLVMHHPRCSPYTYIPDMPVGLLGPIELYCKEWLSYLCCGACVSLNVAIDVCVPCTCLLQDCDKNLTKHGEGCYPLDNHLLCRDCNSERIQSMTSTLL